MSKPHLDPWAGPEDFERPCTVCLRPVSLPATRHLQCGQAVDFAVADLEQRLAVAVEALETVAKYDSHLNPNYLRIVGSNARAALSRIGAGKEGE